MPTMEPIKRPGWCAHRLLYKELLLTDANCEFLLTLFAPGGDLGRHVLLASLFFKDMSMATGVLLHVARPSLAPSGLVPGINDKSPQACVPFNAVLSFTAISLLCYPAKSRRPEKCGLVVRKCARGG